MARALLYLYHLSLSTSPPVQLTMMSAPFKAYFLLNIA